MKGGDNWNRRVTETLADMGAAVFCGAFSTFLAVAVLLGSSSYVFEVLSKQFALTVVLGVSHGLILLPVLLSLFGPKPFSSAESIEGEETTKKADNKAEAADEEASEERSAPVPPQPEQDIVEEAVGAESAAPAVPNPKSFDTIQSSISV